MYITIQNTLFWGFFFILVNLNSALYAGPNHPYSVYETPSPDFIFEDVYTRHKPLAMNPLIARLPEYSNFGPGYICELRQPAMVYRFPIHYNRHTGYREQDWSVNRMYNQHMQPINFGGYTY